MALARLDGITAVFPLPSLDVPPFARDKQVASILLPCAPTVLLLPLPVPPRMASPSFKDRMPFAAVFLLMDVLLSSRTPPSPAHSLLDVYGISCRVTAGVALHNRMPV